jgi:hypothetical protein
MMIVPKPTLQIGEEFMLGLRVSGELYRENEPQRGISDRRSTAIREDLKNQLDAGCD